MSAELLQLKIVDKNQSFVGESVPENSEQAWQAKENREKVAKLTKDSAKIIDKSLPNAGDSMKIGMGVSEKGEKLEGSVEKLTKAGILRVKLIKEGQPEASFAYHGLLFDHPDGSPQVAMIEEIPSASGPDLQPLNNDGIGAKDIRSLALNPSGNANGRIYSGEDSVQDQGAMDYLAATQVLTAAAEQVKANQAKMVQAA